MAIYHRGKCEYAKLEGVSITRLKEIARSPLRYQYFLSHDRPETKARALGTAAHTAVLEPERFLLDYALWTSKGDDGKTKQRRGKKWEEFKGANSDKRIIRIDEYNEAVAIRDAIRADPVAMKYLAMGRPEVAMTWTDAHAGTPARGRIDWLTTVNGRPWLVDLKKTTSVDPTAFARDCARYDYHLQAAYYSDGYEANTGVTPGFAIVAVEESEPIDVAVFVVPPDVLDIGRDEYRKLLEIYKECSAQNDWPGVGRGQELTLALPAWALPDDDDTADLGLTGW